MPRDNFPNSIKKILAQRAGYLCSICDDITVGPSDESDTSVNLTGVAAHITAASSGGKRFDKSLTHTQRESIDNGIWLCTKHADLIDGDEKTYSTPYLKLIKQNHEQKIKLKQSGIGVEKGVITKIELSNFGPITDTVTLEFSDRNIIYGNNCVGKTLVLELIAALSDKSNLDRWTKSRRKKLNSICNIFYFKNQPDKLSISIDKDNKVSYSFNDNLIPILVPTMTILFLKRSYREFLSEIPEKERESKSLVNLMSRYFDLKEEEIVNIIGAIMRGKKLFFNDINLNNTKDNLEIKYYSAPDSPILPFNGLSDGEKEKVILEITLKIANYFTKFNSTILLIENSSFSSIDSKGINHLFEIIRSENLSFQFFFATTKINDYKIKDFKVYELFKNKNDEIIVR